MINDGIRKIKDSVFRNSVLQVYFLTHVSFSTMLGRNFLFAPDESGYLYTFNNLYGNSIDENPQLSSGWITAPKYFLWIIYAPAKVLNLFGIPDYLAIRYLSIILGALAIHFLLKCSSNSENYRKFSLRNPLLIFFVPSIFLWSSIGLRESFIIAELALFFLGANHFFHENEKKGVIFLFLGSFGLISTKNYLWACLSVAILLTCVFYPVLKVQGSKVLKFIVTSIMLPFTLFGATGSISTLEFIIKGSISAVGERSGKSVTTVLIDTGIAGNQTGGDSGKLSVTMSGDSTLISLKTYVTDNPNTIASKTLRLTGLQSKIDRIWDEKLKEAISNRGDEVINESTFNNDVLKPGKLENPISVIRAAFIFLFGPFPFVGDPSLTIQIMSFESPMWWAFFLGIFIQVVRHRHTKFYLEPSILLAIIFLFGEILFSALVEVNLGTSFRHRSILVVPLVYLCIKLQGLKKQKEVSTEIQN